MLSDGLERLRKDRPTDTRQFLINLTYEIKRTFKQLRRDDKDERYVAAGTRTPERKHTFLDPAGLISIHTMASWLIVIVRVAVGVTRAGQYRSMVLGSGIPPTTWV
jgi:hypothetical protein